MEEKEICYKIDQKTLKSVIIEWISLDDQIKVYRETIKDLLDEKNQYEKQILDLMIIIKQDNIQTDKGKIEKNIKKSKTQLTPEIIKLTLTDLLKCQHTAEVYTNKILDQRLDKETISLKRNKKSIKS